MSDLSPSTVVSTGSLIVRFVPNLIQRWAEWKVRELFGIGKDEKLIVVCPSRSWIPTDPNVTTTHEDAMAIASVLVQFARLKFTTEVKLDTQVVGDEQDRREHLFLVCGPVGNQVTAAVTDHESVGLPYRFAHLEQGWAIVDSAGQPLHPPATEKNDYALVAKIANPWSRSDRKTFVFIAAGIEGIGTWGAGHFLAARSDVLLRAMKSERIGPDDRFAAVLECRRDGYRPPDVDLLRLKAV